MALFETMPVAEPPRRKTETFKPRDYLPLEDFEREGWMVVSGAPMVRRNDPIEMKNGSPVNKMKELLEVARRLSPDNLFQDVYIAYDAARDGYVAVHRRTALGEQTWQRANR